MTTNEAIQTGRAKNAVLEFFEDRLIVPKIYLDADWGEQTVDVLAIERDGVGDVHIVMLYARQNYQNPDAILLGEVGPQKELLSHMMSVPAHYKYLGLIAHPGNDIDTVPLVFKPAPPDATFSPDGFGRVGLIGIRIPIDIGAPETKLEVRPERFRAKIAKLADEYVQKHEADWEIRA